MFLCLLLLIAVTVALHLPLVPTFGVVAAGVAVMRFLPTAWRGRRQSQLVLLALAFTVVVAGRAYLE